MDTTRPIPSFLGEASFSFLTSDEILSMSVKQVVNPVLLDNTNTPTNGGLYDPALGPMRKDDICQTCHQNSMQCPGHFGHISLPTPVFHPLFMSNTHVLLRGICLFCHRFKLTLAQRALFQARLRLLDYGLVRESQDLANARPMFQTHFEGDGGDDDRMEADDGDGQVDRPEGQPIESMVDFAKRIASDCRDKIRKAVEEQGSRRGKDTSDAVYAARKRVVAQFLAALGKPKRCPSCNA